MIVKIEISKIVFLRFHERLFQKNKHLYFWKDIVLDYSTVSTILFSHLVTEKIKKIDCQNWNFQNCFPHVSWTPVLDYSTVSTILFSHLVTEKIKKIDCQNWNFQNCFPHVSWTPVPKKLMFIFLKRYRSGLFYSLYNFVLSFGYGENKKNWLSKLKFPKLFSSYFMNAYSKKKKIFIFLKRYSSGLLYSIYHFVLSHLVRRK